MEDSIEDSCGEDGDELFLHGKIVVRVLTRLSARPIMGQRVRIEGGGWGAAGSVLVTGRDGCAEADVPIGKAVICVDGQEEEVWIGADTACCLELYC